MKINKLKTIIENFSNNSIDYDVFIIANTHNIDKETKQWNYEHSTLDEFFSRQEFSEISSAIYNIFGFVKVFYSELEFVEYVMKRDVDRDNLIVINFSRDGKKEGKKSLIPAFCDLLGIKYTGSNAFVISLLRNKFVFSNFLSQLKIPVPNTYLYNKSKGFVENRPSFGRKIVKCVNESASIGMTDDNIIYIDDSNNFVDKIQECLSSMNTENVLVQDFIEGNECEVIVFNFDDEYCALDPVMIKIKNHSIITTNISNAYDYDFGMLSDFYSTKLCEEIALCAEKTARLLNIKTFARFDFRINSKNEFFLIDIAGTPYTIRHSSIAFLFKEYGFEYEDIFKVIVKSTKKH